MVKILVVFGTRPEAIKMCPVVHELEKQTDIDTYVCVTGQHREMLHSVLDVFGVRPDYDLDIMQEGQSLSMITTAVLEKIGAVIDEVKPNLVLVHGDTTTAYVAALAAFYHKVPVGHVEAGLRTNNLYSPYPEEFNRRSIDMVSDILFAPTETAKQNLQNEGVPEQKILVTGNTVIDAMATTVDSYYIDEHLQWAEDSRLILLTAHRRENLGEPMRRMFRAIRRIVENHSDVKVIYPVHMNPEVRKEAEEQLQGEERIRLIEPLDVMTFHNYIAHSYFILTDSGGIQEEAPALDKPVLVMRDETERPEGIKAGTLRLVGTEEKSIYETASQLLEDEDMYDCMCKAKNPYGDGRASERIVEGIKAYARNLNCASDL